MKTKNLLFAATAILAFASCSEETYVGDQNPQEVNGTERAISFSSGTPAITRESGAAAAGLLNNNFVVYGYKTVGGSSQTVFDNYQVNWVTNTAGTTESNSADWEYVSYKNLPFGTTTTSGGTLNSNGVAANATGSTTNVEQSIKYWDYSASQYDFFAYSLGKGYITSGESPTTTYAKATAMSNSTYTLEGTAAQLGTCYISNKKKVVPSTSATEVDLEFRSFLSKIELKFYETIPGYSVKSLSFYPSATGGASTTPYLYTSSEALPTGGKYTITFDTNGKAQIAFDSNADSKTYASNIAFSSTLKNYGGVDYKEASANYLGRASNGATSTEIISVLPNPQNNQALHLMMDFTLVSRDGTGETINLTGATAVIPAAYAMWKPNYKYTYIFKISDNTNAKTGAITGLYPITLDAVVSDAVDGTQETITTVDDPSITTYAKGTMVTANNEYLTGANIYIVVNDGINITAGTDANLYTAVITPESGDNPRPAAQGITEETVANALAKGGSVTDANGATLAVTAAAGLADISEIAAADAPDGRAISIDGVKFTPASAGDYVFEYSATAGTYTQSEANAYNATLPGAISTSDQAYSFTSYGSNSGSPVYGTGKVKVVSTEGEWTTVLVIANSIDGFAGNTYKVHATTFDANAYYQLYSTEGTEQPIWVKIDNYTFTADDVNTYNAGLTGAVTTSSTKPAAKHYKVIKVVTGS